MHAPKLFSGTVARVPGVSMTRASTISVSAESPLTYHVDGEPHIGGLFVKARVHPKALRVMAALR
jgi:diacylglycerol kinase family enzyme